MNLTVLDHDVRRAVLALLRDGERSSGEIAALLGKKRPLVSYHLDILRQAGIVSVRPDGARRVYVLDEERALAAFSAWVCASPGEETP